MGYTIINAILFLGLFVFFLRKDKTLSPKIVLLSVYAIISIMACLFYYDYQDYKYIELWPYLFLFSTCFIYFYPLFNSNVEKSIKYVNISTGIKFLIALYIIFAIIRIVQLAPITVTNITAGDWMLIKENANEGDIGVTNNIIQFIAKIYLLTFMPAMLVYVFYTFTQKRYSVLISSLMLLIAVTPDIMNSLLFAYRGGLFTTVFNVFVIYLLFYKEIPYKKRKFLNGAMSIIGFFIGVLLLIISLSRFGDDNTGNSLISYTGQPMLVFNGGIATRIHDYADGAYFFQCFNNKTRDDIWVDSKFGTSTNDGSFLNTFVGVSYIDFGPILTLIIAVIVSLILSRIFKKKNIKFADLYLYSFYYNYLFLGVFHSSIGFARNVILMLLMYFSLLFFNKKFVI